MFVESVMPSNHLILLFPSPSAFNLSQHQGLFEWFSPLHQVAQLLEFQLQHQVPPMNIKDWFPLGWTGWISLQSKGLSRVFSSTTVWKHQFSGAQPSSWSTSHIRTRPLEKLCLCSVASVLSNSLWPRGHSTPGLPVHHQLPEPTQTHVHCIGDGIQPSHPLSSPFLPAFNLFQHQGLFQ